MRECLSLNIGQAGIQMASACWETYCLEHGLYPDGTIRDPTLQGSGISTLFLETRENQYIARAVNIDSEPSVNDQFRASAYGKLIHSSNYVSGKEDASNNFARGFYTIGNGLIEQTEERIRRSMEVCDSPQGFLLFHSYGGGTGSGFGAKIMHKLSEIYPKVSKLDYAVFPSEIKSSAIVEPYNAVLHVPHSINFSDLTFLMDNDSLGRICVEKQEIKRPDFANMNRLVANSVSSLTSSLRFEGSLNVDLAEFQTNLVPYPRIHFPFMSAAPILTPNTSKYRTMDIAEITEECFSISSQMLSIDPANGKYMSCFLLYRGDAVPKDINQTISKLKNKRDIQFVDWCPTGFKIGINNQAASTLPGLGGDEPIKLNRSVCLLANSSSVQEVWKKLSKKYDLMIHFRAFVHWFVGEGMEESEFDEAREDLEILVKDYKEIVADSDNEEQDEY